MSVVILKQPVGDRIFLTESINMSVIAESSINNILGYQWFLDSVEIAGATRSVAPSTAEGGMYFCRITDDNGLTSVDTNIVEIIIKTEDEVRGDNAPTTTVISPLSRSSRELEISSASDNARRSTENISRISVTSKSKRELTFDHKVSGWETANNNKAEFVFYSERDDISQRYAYVNDLDDDKIIDTYTEMMNVDNSHKYELSTVDYKAMNNRYGTGSSVHVEETSFRVDSYSVSPLAPNSAYENHKFLIELKSPEVIPYITVVYRTETGSYTTVPLSSVTVTIEANLLKISAITELNNDETYVVAIYPSTEVASSEFSLPQTANGIRNNSIVFSSVLGNGDGSGTVSLTSFSEKSDNADVSAIDCDGSNKVYGTSFINNGERSDQSKLSYNVGRHDVVDSDDNEGIIHGQYTMYDNSKPVVINNVYVESNRRLSTDIKVEPYITKTPLDNGTVIRATINNGTVAIKASRKYHSLIKSYINNPWYNTDILDVLTVSGDSVMSTSATNLFADFSNDGYRQNLSTFEYIDNTIVTLGVGLGDISSSSSTISAVAGQEMYINHNLNSDDVQISTYSGYDKVHPGTTKIIDENTVSITLSESIDVTVIVFKANSSEVYSYTPSEPTVFTHSAVNSEGLSIQCFDSYGVYVIPEEVIIIDSTSFSIKSDAACKVVMIPDEYGLSHIEVSSDYNSTITHDLRTKDVVVQCFNSAGDRVIPASIEVLDRQSVRVVSGYTGDIKVVIMTGRKDNGVYSEYMTISGMTVDHNGDYKLYCSNFKASQDDISAKEIVYKPFANLQSTDIKSYSKHELVFPLLEIPGSSTSLKITGISDSSTIVSSDGLVTKNYNVEIPYGSGCGSMTTRGVELNSRVSIVDDIIKCGDRIIRNGKIDISNRRVVPNEMIFAASYTNNEDGRFSIQKDSHLEVINDGVSRVVNTVKGEYDEPDSGMLTQIVTSGKRWVTSSKAEYPYIGREVPMYELSYNIGEDINNDSVLKSLATPGFKRWYRANIHAGMSVDTGRSSSVTTEVFNYSTGLWEVISATQNSSERVSYDTYSEKFIRYDSNAIKDVDVSGSVYRTYSAQLKKAVSYNYTSHVSIDTDNVFSLECDNGMTVSVLDVTGVTDRTFTANVKVRADSNGSFAYFRDSNLPMSIKVNDGASNGGFSNEIPSGFDKYNDGRVITEYLDLAKNREVYTSGNIVKIRVRPTLESTNSIDYKSGRSAELQHDIDGLQVNPWKTNDEYPVIYDYNKVNSGIRVLSFGVSEASIVSA